MASGTSETKTVKASCLCGNASHSITLPTRCFPLPTSMCHCSSCRHMTGALGFFGTKLPGEYQPDPSLFEKLDAFQFSARITQYFCGTCGTHVIERSTTRTSPDSEPTITYGIMTGTFEQFDGVVKLNGHIFIGDTRDGGLADLLPRWKGQDIPRWAEWDGREKENLPLYWHDEAARRIAKHPGPALHAHCKCGGVDFWILRPKLDTARSAPRQNRPDLSGSGAGMCTPELANFVRGESGKYIACHCICNSCRLGAGQEITSWVMVPPRDMFQDAETQVPLKPTFGTLKTYQSSPGRTRSFCSGCGARVFYQAPDNEGYFDVAVGLLDAAEGARADSWLEWQLHRVGFAEDAKGRAESLLLALEEGSRDFIQHTKTEG